MTNPQPEIGLREAVEADDLALIAGWLEYSASVQEEAPSGSVKAMAALLQAAATYRLVAAQQRTGDLLLRLVDAVEKEAR